MRILIRWALLFLLLGASVSVYAALATHFIVHCLPAIVPGEFNSEVHHG